MASVRPATPGQSIKINREKGRKSVSYSHGNVTMATRCGIRSAAEKWNSENSMIRVRRGGERKTKGRGRQEGGKKDGHPCENLKS